MNNKNNKTAIVIQARKGSSRLPNKMVLPFYNGMGLLEIIIKRLKQKYQNTPIILATTVNTLDDELVEIAEHNNITCIRGSEQDVLSRFIKVGEKYEFGNLIRVCADNPFLDVEHINELINQIETNKYDYVSYKNHKNTPVIMTHLGLFTEAVKLNALKKVSELTDDKIYKEHVTNYIYQNPDKFSIKLLDLPKYFDNTENIRLTLDTKEDFELEKQLFSKYKDLATEKLINRLKKEEKVLALMQKNIEKNIK